MDDMGFIYSVVLPDRPGFCTTDNFRKVLGQEMQYLASKARKMLTDPTHAHELLRMTTYGFDYQLNCAIDVVPTKI